MPSLRLYLQRAAVIVASLGVLLAGFAATASASALQPWAAPVHPISVTRPFASPPNPYAAGHRGVDLAGRVDQPIVAAEAGEVSYAANLAGRGVVVVVHGSLRTTYEPVRATVRRGMRIERGQQIGTLESGHAGCPVSACLHWGLLRGEQYLDPMTMLVRAQIRLLPLAGAVPAALQIGPGLRAKSRLTTIAANPATPSSPSPIAWSVAALAGGSVILALRRR